MLFVIINEGDYPENDYLAFVHGGVFACLYDGQPAIFAHSRVWPEMSERQQAWIYAHEEGHVLNGDLERLGLEELPFEEIVSREIAADKYAFAKTGVACDEVIEIMATVGGIRERWAKDYQIDQTEFSSGKTIQLASLRYAAYGK